MNLNDPAQAEAFLRSSLADVEEYISQLEAMPITSAREANRINYQLSIQRQERDRLRKALAGKE